MPLKRSLVDFSWDCIVMRASGSTVLLRRLFIFFSALLLALASLSILNESVLKKIGCPVDSDILICRQSPDLNFWMFFSKSYTSKQSPSSFSLGGVESKIFIYAVSTDCGGEMRGVSKAAS